MPLGRATSGLTLTIEIDLTSEEEVSESTLETKVKETLRQIGVTIREEKLT